MGEGVVHLGLVLWVGPVDVLIATEGLEAHRVAEFLLEELGGVGPGGESRHQDKSQTSDQSHAPNIINLTTLADLGTLTKYSSLLPSAPRLQDGGNGHYQ